MKNIIIFSLSIFCASFLESCHSVRALKKEPAELVRLGSGGGFAGKESLYSVYEDGRVRTSSGEVSSSLGRDVVKQIGSNIKILGLGALEYNSPGNIYQFIEIQDEKGFRRLAWDPQNPQTPSALILFYANLNTIIQKNKK